MKLTVVIVNYNVKHFIEQCLYAVFKALKGIDGEVYVVDNNSVDGSCSMIKEKFRDVKLIENKSNVGFAIKIYTNTNTQPIYNRSRSSSICIKNNIAFPCYSSS